MSKKLVFEEVHVDNETGEAVTTVKKFLVKTTPEKFYMAYIDNLSAFFELKSLVDTKVLQILCIRAEYDSGTVRLPSGDRSEICKFLGISTQQLTNSLSSLRRLKLISGEKGVYKINPSIFWKGSLESRRRVLDKQLQITLNFDLQEENNEMQTT